MTRRRSRMKLRTRRDLNPRCFRTSDFESDTIGHSDTPPKSLGWTLRVSMNLRSAIWALYLSWISWISFSSLGSFGSLSLLE